MGLKMLTDERTQHRYQTCRDGSCERFPCRVYKEGYSHGYDNGYCAGYGAGEAAGYDRGHSDGYAAGYAADAASCGDG
jgi:hypothetical protein